MPRVLVNKPWGWTECVTSEALFEMHRIDIKEGRACSWHHHRHMWNGFACVRGMLAIDYCEGATAAPPETFQTVFLGPGETFDVRPQWTHRMRALPERPVCALEYYWPGGRHPVNTSDIVRVSESGDYVSC